MINIDNCLSLDSPNLITHTPATKHKAEYVCLRMWKCDLVDHTYPPSQPPGRIVRWGRHIVTPWVASQRAQSLKIWTTCSFIPRILIPFGLTMALYSVKVVKGDDCKCGHWVWTQDFIQLKVWRGGAKKQCAFMCTCVLGCPGDASMRSWVCWSNKVRETTCIEVSAAAVLTSADCQHQRSGAWRGQGMTRALLQIQDIKS